MTKRLLICLCTWIVTCTCLLLENYAHGQTVVFTARLGNNLPNYLFQIDLATCTFCPILEIPFGVVQETLVLPNGNVVVSTQLGSVAVYDLPNPNPIATVPGPYWFGSLIHPNGNIYVVAGGQLGTFNPTTNTVTNIGPFPPLLQPYDLFLVGNNMYAFCETIVGGTAVRQVYLVNLTNPAASTLVHPNVPNALYTAATAASGQIISTVNIGANVDFVEYNFSTNSWMPICNTPLTNIQGLSILPPGVPVPACVCFPSSAGSPTVTSANVCAPNAYTATFNTDTQLDPDDAVGYILFTDPANPIGSVLAQNNTGIFPFVPPLVVGTAYYVSRIVGNAVNGQINLNDPCLDISPAIAVTWRPKPTLIALASSSTDLCPGDCITITANLSGTPPFFIYGQFQQNGTGITPQIVNFSPANPAIYTVCAPVNAPSGPINYVICRLLDQFCENN
jgi:hypothetical protein